MAHPVTHVAAIRRTSSNFTRENVSAAYRPFRNADERAHLVRESALHRDECVRYEIHQALLRRVVTAPDTATAPFRVVRRSLATVLSLDHAFAPSMTQRRLRRRFKDHLWAIHVVTVSCADDHGLRSLHRLGQVVRELGRKSALDQILVVGLDVRIVQPHAAPALAQQTRRATSVGELRVSSELKR